MSAGEWAAWVQVLAIAGTGAAAVFVANRQLKAYNAALEAANENERFRNSIKTLDDFRLPTVLRGVTATPLDATLYIKAVARDDAQASRFKGAIARVANGESPPAEPWFKETVANLGIATNYYLDLNELLIRKLVQFEYVMSKMSAFIPDAYDSIKTLHEGFAQEAFSDLATTAREYQSRSKRLIVTVEDAS